MKARGEEARPGYRFIACEGEAHNPQVGGMIDNCGLCAPKWGVVEVLTPEAIRDIATGRKRATIEMAREIARALDGVLSILWPLGKRRTPGLGSVRGDLLIEREEIGRALRDYGPDVPTVAP